VDVTGTTKDPSTRNRCKYSTQCTVSQQQFEKTYSWGTVPHLQLQSGDGAAKRLPIMTACTCILFTSSYAYAECIQVPACCCPSVFVCIWVGWHWCMLHPMVKCCSSQLRSCVGTSWCPFPCHIEGQKASTFIQVRGKPAVAPLPASVFHRSPAYHPRQLHF
jgi:hypothetical protein